jgi:hypothetical protein
MSDVLKLDLSAADYFVNKNHFGNINQIHFNYMKGTTMKTLIAFGYIIMIFVLANPVNAGGKDKLQKYFNDAAVRVKATENASEKRKILNESFQSMSNALNKVQNLGLISKDDRIGIDHFKVALQEKQNELAGINGYERVSDDQLNSFSTYVVQDMEQAEMITISLVTLLLIILLAVLLL